MKKSLQLKVSLLVIFILAVLMSIVIPITIERQKNDLLEAARNTLSINTDMLNLVIKNIMLSGEAPIAVMTMSSLQQIGEFKGINIFRVNGQRAFQDYTTLDFVNNYQKSITFDKTERVSMLMRDNPSFSQVVSSGRAVIKELVPEREMEYYFPIRNERACWECHGSVDDSGPIRGIAHFNISIAGIYKQISNARSLLVIFLTVSVVIFAIFLLIAFRRVVLKPLLHIGTTVSQFGKGQLDINVKIDSNDELGTLSQSINNMFISVRERLLLSKYVSRSTEAMIKNQKDGKSGNKNNLVILFSDVRGFTQFSDKADPELVINRLNQLLDAQSNIVEKYNGDVDKFMGDAVMAQFFEPMDAVKCGAEMVRVIEKITKDWDYPLHIGVGINYGEVVAGNVGSHSRKEFAVIGDTVNLASRLCGVAPAKSVLISESLYKILGKKLIVKPIKNQKIKGKSELITYYALRKILENSND